MLSRSAEMISQLIIKSIDMLEVKDKCLNSNVNIGWFELRPSVVTFSVTKWLIKIRFIESDSNH